MSKMKKVYVFQHTFAYGLNKLYLDTKMLGLFDNKEKAEENIDFYHSLEGFEEYPRECFECIELEIDKNQYWQTGFEERREILEKEYKDEEEYFGY